MSRKFVIAYAIAVSALAAALVWQLLHPPTALAADLSSAPASPKRRLSALAPAGVSGNRKVIEVERRRSQRLQFQLASLQAVQESDGAGKDFVEVDREAFSKANEMVLRGFISIDPANTSLPIALGLSAEELEELTTLFADFRTRLYALEAGSVDYPDGERTLRSNGKRVRVPPNVLGRQALFDGVRAELEELLGSGRGAIALSALQANSLIHPPIAGRRRAAHGGTGHPPRCRSRGKSRQSDRQAPARHPLPAGIQLGLQAADGQA